MTRRGNDRNHGGYEKYMDYSVIERLNTKVSVLIAVVACSGTINVYDKMLEAGAPSACINIPGGIQAIEAKGRGDPM